MKRLTPYQHDYTSGYCCVREYLHRRGFIETEFGTGWYGLSTAAYDPKLYSLFSNDNVPSHMRLLDYMIKLLAGVNPWLASTGIRKTNFSPILSHVSSLTGARF